MGFAIGTALIKYTIIGCGIVLALGWNSALIAALMVGGVTVTLLNV